jgi:hypothetical protein
MSDTDGVLLELARGALVTSDGQRDTLATLEALGVRFRIAEPLPDVGRDGLIYIPLQLARDGFGPHVSSPDVGWSAAAPIRAELDCDGALQVQGRSLA